MKNALFAYQNTEKMSLTKESSANAVLIVIMEELIKCVQIFHSNIDIKTGNMEKKSRGFSKALSIIFALQSSLDLEKGGQIASDLFRLYEYTRIHLIKDMRRGIAMKSNNALLSLQEIHLTWCTVANQKDSNA